MANVEKRRESKASVEKVEQIVNLHQKLIKSHGSSFDQKYLKKSLVKISFVKIMYNYKMGFKVSLNTLNKSSLNRSNKHKKFVAAKTA
jgi:hypothetical protein